MGWSGGTFTRVHDWTDDAGAGLNIEASRMDAEDDNFASGINACRHLGGTNSPTANLPMAGYHHTTVGQATARTDYTRFDQYQDNDGRYGTTGGSANAQTLSVTPAITAYVNGMTFYFKAGYTNTGAATLNVSGVGAAAILYSGAALTGYEITSNDYFQVVFDGTEFHLLKVRYEIGCVATRSTNQAVSASTDTPIEFTDNEAIYANCPTVHSTSSNTSRFYARRTGIYHCHAFAQLDGGSDSDKRGIFITKNGGAGYQYLSPIANVGTSDNWGSVSGLVVMTSGDYVEYEITNVDSSDNIAQARAGFHIMSY